MINYILGFATATILLMSLRWFLYRVNKYALDIELRKLEDEELLKQYKDGRE